MRTKIRQDYAKPLFQREMNWFERFINGKFGFTLFIILMILSGVEI